LPFRGKPLVRVMAAIVRESACHCVAVVAGAGAGAVREALDGLDVEVVATPDFRKGMSSSIHAGVTWANDYDAVLVATCDQLHLTSRHLNRLLRVHARTGGVIASRYEGTLGLPAVFGRSRFAALLALTGDEGAQRLLRNVPYVVTPIDWAEGAIDVDDRKDLGTLARRTRQRSTPP
jgi:molybdenum cofactor cytidylyltransferase